MEVKWAIWTLETQRFPTTFKKIQPYHQLNMLDLVFKRLALVRNWIIYSIQCIHSHLMTLVIQSMGQQLDKKIQKSGSLKELIEIHDRYIDTIYEHCFQTTQDAKLRTAVEQLLNLVSVVHDEWNNMESLNFGNTSMDGSNDGGNVYNLNDAVSQVDAIEATFINCHCVIADLLSAEVYTNDRNDCKDLRGVCCIIMFESY